MSAQSAATGLAPRSGLLRRLPFLVAAGVGLFLWRSSIFPQERELIWQVPRNLEARSVEIQVWQGETLLKREERIGGLTTQGQWTQRLSLRPGDYRAEVFIIPSAGEQFVHVSHLLHVGSAESFRLPLLPR